jgi:Lon protease-like protein
MFDLPLFPLHTVLFPGMPLPLHIFESRYKQMINFCLERDNLFGVVLIRHGSEALGPLAEPHSIGCTARILDVQPLDEGRMNITTIGESRFRIHALNHDLPYLVAEVAPLPIQIDDTEKLLLAAGRLKSKVSQYIHLLNELDEIKLDPDSLPEEPLTLAHYAATLLQMPPAEKQKLLESASALDLLNSADKVYIRENAFLRAMIDHDQDKVQRNYTQN